MGCCIKERVQSQAQAQHPPSSHQAAVGRVAPLSLCPLPPSLAVGCSLALAVGGSLALSL